ncbi:hypothetical protein SUGI_0553790 [Cryptomeria japonica]|uniref:alpha-dioxygenase 1 n=1 Tax=Cryptomeria japonica TaxID=3369 RepID=UPI00240895FF|nr:alpha-dioxygenase 1 [Cryptomeria japonica]GLJ28195.1 hypothetical protein SUGI_0553790 [Cryptomeria japonica]
MALLRLLQALLPTSKVLDKNLYSVYSRMTFIDKILFLIIHFVDRVYAWHKLPVFLGLAYLEIRRTLHQRYNLLNVGSTPVGVRYNPVDYPYRTADGKYNDPFNQAVGSEDTFFGRNMLPSPQKDEVLRPDPMVVATKLLARRKLVDTDKQFNMLAASWIQFMIHDWVDHVEDTKQGQLTAPQAVAQQCPLKTFKFFESKKVPTGFYDIKEGYLNRRTAWWDGSEVYGNNFEQSKQLRTFNDGKLNLGKDGLLLHSDDGIPISGDVRNSWAGLSVLQALFIKEHNDICDMLKDNHNDFDDEKLYRHARLVTSAIIAKIHTIDWTVELLKTDTLLAGMRANWYGLLGKKLKDRFGHTGSSILSGFVGMPKPENHGVPYSLTEEFVSVYRMHSLMPDNIVVRDIHGTSEKNKTPKVLKEVDLRKLVGINGERTLSEIGNEKMIVSMGHQASGALTLWNYPMFMRDLIVQDPNGHDRPDHVDLAALEIYRDRERSVSRYNQFRRNMLMIPITKWEDLTDDKEAIQVLREVYGNDVENLDLLVGLMAEKKIKGYAISETAFFIFVLMASRRLEADRFFTSDFNEEVYTKEGLARVNSTESLKDVLNRHYPEMVKKWVNSSSAFSVWSANPEALNLVPLYLRIPS